MQCSDANYYIPDTVCSMLMFKSNTACTSNVSLGTDHLVSGGRGVGIFCKKEIVSFRTRAKQCLQ